MIQYTLATKQDIPQIIQCRVKSMVASFCEFYGVDESSFQMNLKEQELEMESFFDKGVYFIVKDFEKVVGVACACADNWIRTVWVLPEYQRQGIGKKLVQSCIDSLKGDIYISTGHQDNDRALNFYKNLGFVETGLIKEKWFALEQKKAIQDIELVLRK